MSAYKPITLANIMPPEKTTGIMKFVIKFLDFFLGIKKLNAIYTENDMSGLPKDEFAEKLLLKALNLNINGIDELQAKIPKTGPVMISANHPFGGIEGVILALYISRVRPDLKVLVNEGLRIFPELKDYFIFTNPLSERNPKNGPSLRHCKKHLQSGGALLIFPAGRVSYYQPEKGRISEHEWNRVVGRLIQSCDATYLPVFIEGTNSKLFYNLGRIYYRLRMLRLAHELSNKKGATVNLYTGNPVPAKMLGKTKSDREVTDLCKALSYAQDPISRQEWAPDPVTHLKPLAEEIPASEILEEVANLPEENHLLDYREYAVYYGFQKDLPKTLHEIARQREITFRDHNEGSGEPIDTDHFDATYTHLFAIQKETGKLVGAYRMGQTDLLLKDGDLSQLYLSKMFKFGPDFVNQKQPCLEMGRSFIVKEYQGSFHGLFMLWRGISTFMCRNPRYRVLYGTVSISKLYDMRSAAFVREALVTPTNDVKPVAEMDTPLHPELQDYQKAYSLRDDITPMLTSVEQDGKDIPVLLKHYMKLEAKFHCLGIDKSFNDTPGLLLSVDLPKAPAKQLKLYLGDGRDEYLAYDAEA
ncbi:lysophospholipid acyltransferase family protein [Alteromonadaceae bacterium M269]|nr:lysophospholipid acyltransferase family protein [Alteromonadaceae bacterium M269]